MIIGIGGWERSLKTGLAAILSCEPGLETINSLSQQKYDIKQGYGNLHFYDTQYPWEYLETRNLVKKIRNISKEDTRNTLFVIDEADQVYNPRDYTKQEQTENLKGLGQHAKMGNIFIVTYQLGKPDDPLLGVDKMLRSLMRVIFEMRYYDIEKDYAVCHLESYLNYKPFVTDFIISNVKQYFRNWDHLETVV